jgi:16S rRNA processing protein RimM
MIDLKKYLEVGFIQKPIGFDGRLILNLSLNVNLKKSISNIVILVNGSVLPFHIKNKKAYILFEDLEEKSEKLFSKLNYKVFDNEKEIGQIVSIENSTKNIIAFLKNYQDQEIIIPFSENFIKKIDDEKKIIYMSLPIGLY